VEVKYRKKIRKKSEKKCTETLVQTDSQNFINHMSGNDRLILSYFIYPVSFYVLPTEYLGIPSVIHISPVLRWSIYRLSTVFRPFPYVMLTS